MTKPTARKLTPVLCVEAIEPCLSFWVERLGYEVTIQVPEGDRLGFAALAQGPTEVMLQTHASVRADVQALADEAQRSVAFLFLEVEDIDAVAAAMAGVEPLVPRRETFYGATEIGYREPGGNIVVFAQMGGEGS